MVTCYLPHFCFQLSDVKFITALQVNIARADFSADDCKSLGFNKANLLCSTCEEFNKRGLTEIWQVNTQIRKYNAGPTLFREKVN